MANHLSRLPFDEGLKEMPIRDSFLGEQLYAVTELPCYAHIMNYLVMSAIPEYWTAQDRGKFFVEVRTLIGMILISLNISLIKS